MFLKSLFIKAATVLPVVLNKTDVDFDYLQSGGTGAFEGIKLLIMGYLADTYQLLIAVGTLVLVIVASVAAICFGALKHNQKIMENKEWLMRALIVIAIIAAIPTVAGAAYAIGQSAEDAMEETTGKSTSSIEYVLPVEVTMDC